jgi:hypothetical protein
MVDLTKCQIKIANLINCKSQWPLSMVNLTNLGHLDGPLAFFDQMFGLSHGQKCHFNQMC